MSASIKYHPRKIINISLRDQERERERERGWDREKKSGTEYVVLNEMHPKKISFVEMYFEKEWNEPWKITLFLKFTAWLSRTNE